MFPERLRAQAAVYLFNLSCSILALLIFLSDSFSSHNSPNCSFATHSTFFFLSFPSHLHCFFLLPQMPTPSFILSLSLYPLFILIFFNLEKNKYLALLDIWKAQKQALFHNRSGGPFNSACMERLRNSYLSSPDFVFKNSLHAQKAN